MKNEVGKWHGKKERVSQVNRERKLDGKMSKRRSRRQIIKNTGKVIGSRSYIEMKKIVWERGSRGYK